jgi:hypothetical protein
MFDEGGVMVSEQKEQGVSKKSEIKIEFPGSLRGGSYCNTMFVNHTKEEFIIDFMMIALPTGTVTSRVIISPGHMKRVISALQNNLKKYESQYGTITEAAEPTKGKIGFVKE